MKEKKNWIKEYITKEECNYMCDDIVFDCEHCSCSEDCYMRACDRCDNELADSVAFGGYNTEDEFWEQI